MNSRQRHRLHSAAISFASLVIATAARADEPSDEAGESTPPAASETGPTTKITPLGYVEANYSYNFGKPANGITNYRGFDNRHNTFTLSNVALGAAWESGAVSGRLVLQVGHTPSTYYLSEPSANGAASNATGPEFWKYLQEANIGWKAPVGRGLLLQAGLFLSPIGPEVVPVKDNWNWSRSNLFFGLPYYHTGIRATYELTDAWAVTVAGYNGWNSVVDNNEDKSVSASIVYKIPNRLLAQLLYFGGVERGRSAPEGQYWRHDIDAYAQLDATSRLSFLVHANAGWEPNRFGTSSWAAGAVYARVKATDWLYVAVRGDRFYETAASNSSGTASALFWNGVGWVSSGTATLDFRPLETLSFRTEYRHDQADGQLFFKGDVAGAGTSASPFVPNADHQDTLTFGATAWF